MYIYISHQCTVALFGPKEHMYMCRCLYTAMTLKKTTSHQFTDYPHKVYPFCLFGSCLSRRMYCLRGYALLIKANSPLSS